MLIGIISDTHDNAENTREAVELFREKKIKKIYHLGDFCSPGAIVALEGTNGIGILGNNDGDIPHLQEALSKVDWELKGHFYEEEVDGLSLALYHGTEPSITRALIDCGHYDVVLSGHTHKEGFGVCGDTLHINPGTIHGFGSTPTLAVLDTKSKEVEIFELS